MKNNSIRNDTRYSRKQTTHRNSRNSDGLFMEVQVAAVKSWKDTHEHEKIRRQRQDLFDNWEQPVKKNISSK